ncbi:unnamed protein product [Polarella glacialis]|uniref:J domain-containing protein n=1 Tax=Polarella glacialis TaxID=89957 RepID=A0A813KXZ0_POLGL|nr:unnamed protein product [Polarella glacialis]
MASRSWEDDESLPLLFLVRVLGCLLVPWTGALAWWLKYPGRREIDRRFPEVSKDGHRVRHCHTAAMASKRAGEERQLKSWRHSMTLGFVVRTSLLLLLWAWFAALTRQWLQARAQNLLYEGFDPYKVLGVTASTGEVALNKAFRKEALKYHPDKNSDPGAAEKFLLSKKALDSLTDPESMSNFKTFGNPDGPQYVQLYAINSFIKDKDASRADGNLRYKKVMFRAADLQLYLGAIMLCLLIILFMPLIPSGDARESSFRKQLSAEAEEKLAQGLKSALSVVSVRDLLLLIEEDSYSNWFCSKRSTVQALDFLAKELLQGNGCSVAGRAAALFFAHVHRQRGFLEGSGHFAQPLVAELEARVQRWRSIAGAMVDIAADGAPTKAVVAAIDLQRCLVQALDPEAVSTGALQELLQIPHFSKAEVATWQQGRQKSPGPGLAAFLDLQTANRKAQPLPCFQASEAIADIEEFAADAWWVVLEMPGDERPVVCKRLANSGREIAEEVKFEVPSSGKLKCKLSILSESYFGLDADCQASTATTTTATQAGAVQRYVSQGVAGPTTYISGSGARTPPAPIMYSAPRQPVSAGHTYSPQAYATPPQVGNQIRSASHVPPIAVSHMPVMPTGPPQPPGSLTANMPDPASIESQKDAYSRSLEEQARKGEELLKMQQKQQVDAIYQASEAQKKQLLCQIDQQAKQQELEISQRYAQQVMSLQQEFQNQKMILERQAHDLAMEYQKRKSQEDMLHQQYEMQRAHYDDQVRMMKEIHQAQQAHEDQAQQTYAQQAAVQQPQPQPQPQQAATGSYVPPPQQGMARSSSYVPPPAQQHLVQSTGSFVPPVMQHMSAPRQYGVPAAPSTASMFIPGGAQPTAHSMQTVLPPTGYSMPVSQAPTACASMYSAQPTQYSMQSTQYSAGPTMNSMYAGGHSLYEAAPTTPIFYAAAQAAQEAAAAASLRHYGQEAMY